MRRPEVPPMPALEATELRRYAVRRRDHTVVVAAEVRCAVLPPGSYRTRGGARTAEEMDAVLDWGGSSGP
ncbi:hypothetical protein ACFWVT_19465 [Streptomyces cyaneofuscatus]|uniref:hypothetical protein n=1 Tax=Streptomyces cyaneofuscatus TaxID=66883 RepID=UPI00364F03B5